VQDIFLKWTTARLRGYLIWIPMLAADDLDAAIVQEANFQEARIRQYWDGERFLAGWLPKAWDWQLLSPGISSCCITQVRFGQTKRCPSRNFGCTNWTSAPTDFSI
jgi:hypothetical protein